MVHQFSKATVAAVMDFAILKPDQTTHDLESAVSLCGELSLDALVSANRCSSRSPVVKPTEDECW